VPRRFGECDAARRIAAAYRGDHHPFAGAHQLPHEAAAGKRDVVEMWRKKKMHDENAFTNRE